MTKLFDISINIMGDVKPRTAKVNRSENSNNYDITLPDGNQIAITFSENDELVQTAGIPLDSNTLHSISEAIKKNLVN